MNYLSLCLIVKDEDEDYLLDWVGYHLSIGVEAFFIYDNQSKTPVRDVLQEYIQKGIVLVLDIPGEHQQDPAYTHSLYFFGDTTKWLGFIDADEFIVPKTKVDLKTFLRDYEDYGGLSINWAVFGSNGWEQKPPIKQRHAFTLREKVTYGELGIVKCIVQPARVINLITPHEFLYKSGYYAVGEHFDRMNSAFRPISFDKIQINHYLLRSREQFMKKIMRGRSDHNRPYYQLSHFDKVNQNATVEDTSIITCEDFFNQHPIKVKEGTLANYKRFLPPQIFSAAQIDFLQLQKVAFEAKNKKDWDTLITLYQESVRKYPDLPSSYQHLCEALLQQGRFSEAWQTLIKSPQEMPLLKAKCLRLMGSTRNAILIYEQWLTTHPNDKEVLLWCAELYKLEGNLRTSLQFYDQILQQDPFEPRAWENLLNILQLITLRENG